MRFKKSTANFKQPSYMIQYVGFIVLLYSALLAQAKPNATFYYIAEPLHTDSLFDLENLKDSSAESHSVIIEAPVFVEVDQAQVSTEKEVESETWFRPAPVEDFFLDWDTAVVDPYEFDLKELTYDFPVCLFIGPDDSYALPLKSLYRTSPFGPRWGRHHKGIDFDVNVGDSVFNMFDGMVRISTYSKSFGHFIVVRHFNGLETLYAHLSERFVLPGDVMYAGNCLGLGGNTGRSTGPHLHFEVRYKGVAFDPEKLINTHCQDIHSEELIIAPTLFSYTQYKTRRNSSGNAQYHKIKQGETLSSIAVKYKTSVSQLCKLNGIRANSIIRAGKSLRVR